MNRFSWFLFAIFLGTMLGAYNLSIDKTNFGLLCFISGVAWTILIIRIVEF